MIRIYFLFVLSWIGVLPLSAQVLVSTNKLISQDTTLVTIRKSVLDSKTVVTSGQAIFSSRSGYVRILLSNDNGYDLLVYETSPLLSINGVDNFTNKTIESINIPANSALTKIRVEIKNAELRNLSVAIPTGKVSFKNQQQTRVDMITLINNNLRSQNALWVAGETNLSQMTYEEKKSMFGGKVPDLQGFEYYIGGIFELYSDSLISTKGNIQSKAGSPFISSFDWRDRHDRNWITSVKNQDYNQNRCGSCVIFSIVGTIEALTNLYYNQLLNIDLSEQSIVSCFPNGGNCAAYTGWPARRVIDYIVVNGVCEESCFPYTATDEPCLNKCINPTENIKINGWIECGTTTFPRTEDAIKRNIIKYGPLSSSISIWGHAMSLIGYKEIEAGETVYEDGNGNTTITIPLNDSRIGKTSWLFKNSYGPEQWHGGWVRVLLNNISHLTAYAIFSPIISQNYTTADIVCEDRDGDGYYFWGIGSKPATCPSCAPDNPDGDDSDPDLGPMNEYGYCEVITTPLIDNITTTPIWSVNKSVCKNVVVHFGAVLTITANIEMSNHKITVKNGGKLILNGGVIDNGNVVVEPGGEFKTLNNGKILLGNGDFEIKSGAKSEMFYGEISHK